MGRTRAGIFSCARLIRISLVGCKEAIERLPARERMKDEGGRMKDERQGGKRKDEGGAIER
jgi:hypothetical protein